ncbi:MAG: hypothetical protein ACT4P1_01065 [Sporichthyaceae bacterium]
MGSHRAPSGHRASAPVAVGHTHHSARTYPGVPRAVLLETAGWIVFAVLVALVVLAAAG